MWTYRITTNGQRFRVEMQYASSPSNSWITVSGREWPTLQQAIEERRACTATPPDVWVPVTDGDAVTA